MPVSTESVPSARGATGDARAQARIGLSLAAAIIGGWAATLAWGLFFHPSTPAGWIAAPLVVALQCWLNTGLFIVAHDCMHGSLAPGRPRLNRAVGRLSLALYAGFSFDRLLPCHHAHHRHAGTEGDPDFDAAHPDRFWRWYFTFLRRYFGWREFAAMALISWTGLLVLGVPPARLLLFWALPAILSSLQLFRWGTWLPHRHEAAPFADHHRARSSPQGVLYTLLTCFHFGLHHEHHLRPGLPWWALPAFSRARRGQGSDRRAA